MSAVTMPPVGHSVLAWRPHRLRTHARVPRSAPPRPAPPLVFFFNAQQLGDPASNSTTRVFGGFPRGPASQPRAAARAGYSLQRPTPASVRDRIPRPEQGRRRPF